MSGLLDLTKLSDATLVDMSEALGTDIRERRERLCEYDEEIWRRAQLKDKEKTNGI